MVACIASFTDFGPAGPYTGQMHAVLAQQAPATPVIDLLSLAPAFAPRPAAYLLAALAQEMGRGTLFLCVVDPGVGGSRRGLALHSAGQWFVGPDNGLLALSAARDPAARLWTLTWEPSRLSSSFHGRDLFAPVAAMIANGEPVPGERCALASMVGWDWPSQLPEVIFIDHYGNAFTGLAAGQLPAGAGIRIGGRCLGQARTFSEVAPGEAFWYANSCGLVELAVNGGDAASVLGVRVGDRVLVE